MKCKIIYKRDPNTLKITDEVQAVKAPNGMRSLLYDAIRNKVNNDKVALNNYFKVYTDEFKEDFGDWENFDMDGSVDGMIQQLMLKKHIVEDPFSPLANNSKYNNIYDGFVKSEYDKLDYFIDGNKMMQILTDLIRSPKNKWADAKQKEDQVKYLELFLFKNDKSISRDNANKFLYDENNTFLEKSSKFKDMKNTIKYFEDFKAEGNPAFEENIDYYNQLKKEVSEIESNIEKGKKIIAEGRQKMIKMNDELLGSNQNTRINDVNTQKQFIKDMIYDFPQGIEENQKLHSLLFDENGDPMFKSEGYDVGKSIAEALYVSQNQELKDKLDKNGEPKFEEISDMITNDDVIDESYNTETIEKGKGVPKSIYKNLGYDKLITPDDKVVFGHPGIGKTFLKEQGNDQFISLDDDYYDNIVAENAKIIDRYKAQYAKENNGKKLTKYQIQDGGNKPWNRAYNKMMQELFMDVLDIAKKQGKSLMTSNTKLLKNNIDLFDKVVDIETDTFVNRIKKNRPNAKYDIDEWKSQINEVMKQVPDSKRIETKGYLSQLMLTSEQYQDARQVMLDSENTPPKQYSLQSAPAHVGQPTTESSEGSVAINLKPFEEMVSDDGFTDVQMNIMKAYNKETETLTGGFVDIEVEKLSKDLQKMFELKGITKTPVYETIDHITGEKGFVNYRVSNLQDLKKVQYQTKEIAQAQEQSPKSVVARERGTQMHDMNEKMLAFFVKSNNGIFMPDTLREGNFDLWAPDALAEFKKSPEYQQLLEEGKKVFITKQKMDKFTQDAYLTHSAQNMVDKLAMSMLSLYHQVHMTQQAINKETGKNNKPIFILEKPFMDKGNNQAGTMDVFVIFSDGTASIYDHKFTDLSYAPSATYKGGDAARIAEIKRIRKAQGLPDNNELWYYEAKKDLDLYKKEEAWNAQIGRYSEMARKLYNVKSIRQARILPVATTYTKVDLGNKTKTGHTKLEVGPGSMVEMILTGHSKDEGGVSQLALNIEKTGDVNLDRFIGMLIKNKESLNKEMKEKQAWGEPKYVERIKELDKSIQGLLKSRDITNISKSIEKLAQQIENDLTNETERISFEQIITHLGDIEMFNSFIALSSDEIDKLEKKAKEETKEGEENPYLTFKKRLSDANYELTRQAEKMHAKMTSMVAELNTKGVEELGIEGGFMSEASFDRYKQQKDMSTLGVYFTHLRESNHPIVSLFSQLLDGIETNVMKERRTLEDKLNKVQKDLDVWGRSRGLKGPAIYNDIINKENGNLIRMFTNYKKELFPDHSDPKNHKANIKWFKENFERTGVKEQMFKDKYKQIQEFYKRKHKDDEAAYNKEIEDWLNKNDINHNNGDNQAWYNIFRQHWLTPKNPKEYYTDEYKNLLKPNNKPLLDFYNLYTKQMNMLASKADFRIYENGIPEIRKDMIDTMVQDGMFMGGKQQAQNIVNWWQKDDNDDGMQKIITEDGLERKVPIFFQNNVGKENKSMDLAKSLMLFSDFVNKYNGIKGIEHASLAMRELVAKTAGLQSKITGEILRNEAGDAQLKVGAEAHNDKLLQAFDTWVGYYIYGEKKKGDAKVNKAVDAITALSSRKAVALNHVSAIGGHINAEAQLQMIAKKTTYFTVDTLTKARKEVKLGLSALRNAKESVEGLDSKMVFASMFFEIAQEDMSYEKANGISLSKLRRGMKKDYAYMLQRWSDDIIDNTTMTAMLMDYGIDPITGKVYPLSRLRETYKDYEGSMGSTEVGTEGGARGSEGTKYKDIEFKSLWDMMEMTGDKVKEAGSPLIVNQFTGEAISDKTFTDFRRKARTMVSRAKGNMSADDIAGYKTHAVGRLVMQFRGWIPATVRERFKGEQYNLTMEQMEVGRFVAVKNMVGKNLKRKALQFAKEIMPFLKGDFGDGHTMSDILDEQSPMRLQYNQFIADNPHLAPDPDNPSLEQVTYEEYVNTHIAEVRALAKELQMYFALAGSLGLLSFAAGDDELKNNPLLRYPATIIERSMLELGFFIPIFGMSEQAQLFTRAPAASISLFTSAAKTVQNTFTEGYDLFTGAKWDETTIPTLGDKPWSLNYDTRKDSTMPGYYTHQWIPPVKFLNSIIGFTNTTKKSDTWFDYWTENWDILR